MAKKDDVNDIPEVDPSKVRKVTLTLNSGKSRAQREKAGEVIKVTGHKERLGISEAQSAKTAYDKKQAYQSDKQRLAGILLRQAGDTPQNRKKIQSTISMMNAGEIAEVLADYSKDLLYSPAGVEAIKPAEYIDSQEAIKRAKKILSDQEEIAKDTGTLNTANQDKMEEMTPETVLQGKFQAAGVYETARELIQKFQEYEAATVKPELDAEYIKAFKILRSTKLKPSMLVAGHKKVETSRGLMHDDEGEAFGGENLEGLSEADITGLTEEEWKMVNTGKHFGVVVGMLGRYANDKPEGGMYDSTKGYDVMTATGPQSNPYLLAEEYSVALGLRTPTEYESSILAKTKGIRDYTYGELGLNYDDSDSLVKASVAIGLPEIASKQQYLESMAELYINIDYTGSDREDIKKQLARHLDKELEKNFASVNANNRMQNQLLEASVKDFMATGGEIYKPQIQSYMSALPSVESIAGLYGEAIVEPLTRFGQDARFYEGGEDTASSMLRVAAANLRGKSADELSERQLYDATMLIGLKHSASMAAEKFYRVGGNAYEDSMSGKGMQKNYRNFGGDEFYQSEDDVGTESYIKSIIDDIDLILSDRDRDESRDGEFTETRPESDRFARDRLSRLVDMGFEPSLNKDTLSNIEELKEALERELDNRKAGDVSGKQLGLDFMFGTGGVEDTVEELEAVEEAEEEEEEEVEVDEQTTTSETTAAGTSSRDYTQGSFDFADDNTADHTTVEAPNVTRGATLGMTRGGAPLVERQVNATSPAPNVKMDASQGDRAAQEKMMLDKFFAANPHLERGPDQRTEEWHKARQSQITSSNVGSFLFNTNAAIKNRLSSIFNPKEKLTNEHIERGVRLEPKIKEEWEKQNPGQMLVDVGLVHNKKLGVGSTSPDAMIFDRETGEWTGKLAEIKAPMRIQEGTELASQRAKHNNQMQHQMMVMGATSNELVQGVEEFLDDTATGRRSGTNTPTLKLDTSTVGADPTWERDNKKKLQLAQRSLDTLVGLDRDQLNDMLDSNSVNASLGARGQLKITENKTPYIFTEEHGRVLQQQDQDYVSGKRSTGASSAGSGGGGGGKKSTVGPTSPDDDDDEDSSLLGKFGGAKNKLLAAFKGPMAVASMLGKAVDFVGEGAEGLNNFVGAAYDIGMKPADYTMKAGSMMMEGMTLNQSSNAMGQTQLMAGGMEVGMFDGAKKLVIATRGALTFEDIQKYGDDPEKLMALLRQRTGGQVSDRGLMAMMNAGGLETGLLRAGQTGAAHTALAAANTAKPFSKMTNVVGAGIALADDVDVEKMMGEWSSSDLGGSYNKDTPMTEQQKTREQQHAGRGGANTNNQNWKDEGSSSGGGKDRVDVVVHVKSDRTDVAGKRGNQVVQGTLGPNGRAGPNIGNTR